MIPFPAKGLQLKRSTKPKVTQKFRGPILQTPPGGNLCHKPGGSIWDLNDDEIFARVDFFERVTCNVSSNKTF
jgi:hypothetical protein